MSNHNISLKGAGVIQENREGAFKSDDVFDAELGAETAKRTTKLMDTSIELALRVKEAREFIAWSANHMRTSWLDWMDESTKANQHMNQFRMAFDRESKSIIATAKDVVSFFNSTEYEEALIRLTETVNTLERFAQLKRNGALDTLADFILKIQCPPSQ